MIETFQKYKNLIWMLAVTDFRLRYQNSFLGYIWALLQPLLLFLILNFVFSSLFARSGEIEYYALQLITSLMIFLFFAEATSAGLRSLVSKSQLVTKIYVPRWTIIIASTLNAFLIFLTNLVVIAGFFAWYKFVPSILSIAVFAFFIICLYITIVGFSLIAAPLFVRFRDASMIWEVVTRALMYLSPILYPLSLLPQEWHKIILLNPVAFIIHFNKEALINSHFADPSQYIIFGITVISTFIVGIYLYKIQARYIAEHI
jgi:lipopolysaccharide transport system permease protein